MSPLTAIKVAILWVRLRPLAKLKQARRRKRRLIELGIEKETTLAVNTGLRSSSNMVLAGGLTNIIVEVLQMVWPEFVLSAEMRTYLTLGIAWLATRFTKTPPNPGAV